jgi:hypothetical protein
MTSCKKETRHRWTPVPAETHCCSLSTMASPRTGPLENLAARSVIAVNGTVLRTSFLSGGEIAIAYGMRPTP